MPVEEPAPRPDHRLQDVNERLILSALEAQEAADTSAQRCRVELEHNAELKKKEGLLRLLASELILAEQRERKRLATELHDYLAQLLVLGRLKVSEVLPKIATSDSKLVSLVSDIDEVMTQSLAYTRTLMAELTPTVLYELGLPSALAVLSEQMSRHDLSVEVRLPPQQVQLPNDQAVLLYQSARELLFNVVKHARTDRATVTLLVENGDTLVLTVQDQGHGASHSLLEAKPSEHFGLFSIRERMEVMGGSLETESAVGRGTTATLRLPLAPHALSQPVRAARTAAYVQPRLRRADQAAFVHRLLLVDDHAMVRQGLRAILESYSDVLVIGEAENGVEAVSMATDLGPHVVVMDINMPKMGGIEATRQIKADHPEVIVIGLSFNTSPPVIEAMTAAGATAFVSKDAAGEELYDTIATLDPLEETPPIDQQNLPFSAE